MVCLGRPYHFKLFKGYLPYVLLGPFLNTLTHFSFDILKEAQLHSVTSGSNNIFDQQFMLLKKRLLVDKVTPSSAKNNVTYNVKRKKMFAIL